MKNLKLERTYLQTTLFTFLGSLFQWGDFPVKKGISLMSIFVFVFPECAIWIVGGGVAYGVAMTHNHPLPSRACRGLCTFVFSISFLSSLFSTFSLSSPDAVGTVLAMELANRHSSQLPEIFCR